MLQTIISPSEKYTLAEQAQMAIEGGCGWIEIHANGSDNGELRTEITEQIIPMCKESQTILTIADNPAMAKETGMHGVFVSNRNSSPITLRGELGIEAIVGAEIDTEQAAVTFANADIDFVRLPNNFPIDKATALITSIREAGCRIPVVLQGDYTTEDVPAVMGTGASGIASGKILFDAEDPVEAIRRTIETLTPAED